MKTLLIFLGLSGLLASLCLATALASSLFPSSMPVEESIIRYPFAPPSGQQRLLDLLEERRKFKVAAPPTHDMGWRWRDRDYYRRIPWAARRIPAGWSRLPVVRFTNSELDADRDIWLSVNPQYDQWLLHDHDNDIHACISVERATRRVYFFEFEKGRQGKWQRSLTRDNCYSCHPSGPRVIRPLAQARVDRKTLAAFNRRILSYGACDFWGSVNLAVRGQPLADQRCVGCHNGVWRGRLYAIHRDPIAFKTQEELTMPPRGQQKNGQQRVPQ